MRDLAERQYGLFTRGQALRLGVPDRTLNNHLLSGVIVRMHPGVYRIHGSVRGFHQSISGACLAGGDRALASHRAAGTLWRLEGVTEQLEIAIPENQRIELDGVAVHRAVKPARPRAFTIDDIPVTPIARTLIDLAGVLSLAELATTVDDAWAQRLVVPGSLRRRLDELGRRGRKGAGRLRMLLDERSDAAGPIHRGFERRLYRLLVDNDLPKPRPQFPITWPDLVRRPRWVVETVRRALALEVRKNPA